MSTSRTFPSRRPLGSRATTALVASAIVAALVAAPAPRADAQVGPDLRINEFSSAGPGGSSDDFIELINLGDAPADLEGWALYRCAGTGSRSYDPQVPPFGDVTLAPGDVYVVAHEAASPEVASVAAEFYATSLADGGSGVWLADPDERRVDSVAMYGPGIDSECGIDGGELPNVLDYARDQTYQRVDVTGDNATDWIAAARTPGAANATVPDPGVQPSDVLITELTNGGAGGSSDNFVEISNRGDGPVDVSGWVFSRCTASGIRTPSTVQATVPDGTSLAPGDSFVFAHTVVAVPAGVPHVRYTVSLANGGFGAVITDADGIVRDAVGVFDQAASPCTQGTAAPNTLDFGFDETWQRRTDTGDNASDFHVRPRTLGTDVVPDPADDPRPPSLDGPVRVSELANAGPAGTSDNFFELANYGDAPVDVSGWRVHRCQADGRRNATPQVTVAAGTVLAPGDTYLAVRAGGPLAADPAVDATYGTSFAQEGFGVVVYDAGGEVVDRVAAYGPSSPAGGPAMTPCTNVLHVTTHLDTARGMSFQRLGFEGRDASDFVEAPRTPGALPDDLRRPWDRTAEELAPVTVEPQPRPLAATDLTTEVADDGEVTVSARAAHTTGADHEVELRATPRLPLGPATRGFTGVSDVAPLAARTGDDETAIAAAALPVDGRDAPTLITEDHDRYPYQRYELAVGDVGAATVEVAWSGRSVRSNEVQLYAWDHDVSAWVLLDAAGGRVDEVITLLGRADVAASVRGGRLDVLVIDGRGTGAALRGSHDGFETFGDPSSYDGAMVHLTDTQFLAESHRDVYADMIQWILQNEDARRIDYSIHTGDVIETWLNGTHLEAVARDEFDAASDIMAMLDDAGHPYGILPGNHDDKWGRDKDLYDEYFGLERYADNPWFGGSFPAGTNHNHWDLIEIGGKEVLVVNLGYFEGDAAIAWANEVIAAHPDHDVIFATHEYLNTSADHSTTENYRWTSLGRRYFDEIVAPNENVFLTLSGHYHGIAQAVRRVEDGIVGDDRVVLELLADYQNFEREGLRDTGFQRLLQFDWDAGLMAVNTYSATLGEHNSYEYDQPARRYGPEDDEFLAEITVTPRYDKRVATDRLGVQVVSDGAPLIRTPASDGEVVTATFDGDGPVAWYAVSLDADGQRARTAVEVAGWASTDPDPDPDPGTDPDPDPGTDPDPDPGTDPTPGAGVTCPAVTAPFRDVPADSLHRDAVGCLAELGVVLGKGAGRFDPAGSVRRDQAASMVARLLEAYGIELPVGRGFADVPSTSLHADAVAGLAQLGVLVGKDGDRFDPAGRLTRAQIASVLTRAVAVVAGGPLPPGPDAFDDDAGSPHEAAIDAATAAGLVEGKGGRRFAPGDDLRRDQLASLLARAIGHLER